MLKCCARPSFSATGTGAFQAWRETVQHECELSRILVAANDLKLRVVFRNVSVELAHEFRGALLDGELLIS
ncbi:MAG: hypothetical protein V8T87_00840 [Victivallales bacterium]